MFKNLSDTKKVEIYNDKDMHNKKVKLFVSFDNNNKIVEFNTCLFNDEIMFEKAIKRLEEINISFSFYENKKKPAYLHYQYINKINTDFNEYFKIEMKNEWYLESYKESLDIKRMQLQETYEFSVIGLLVDIRNNIDSYDFRSVFSELKSYLDFNMIIFKQYNIEYSMIVNKDEYSEEDINIILFESINLMFNLTTKYMESTNNDRYRNRDKFLMMIDY